MDLTSNPKHAELERKKQNLHTVYNPTDTDYKIVLNAAVSPEVWTIKAHSEEIVPEYVVKKYLKEMSQLLIVSQSDDKVKRENERRANAGLQPMNLYDEQFRFESRSLKLTEDQTVKMMAQLYRGLYKEYGLDPTPEISPLMKQSNKPSFETAINKIFNGEYEKEEISVPTNSPNPPQQTIKEETVELTVQPQKSDMKSKMDEELRKVSKK